MLSNVSCDEGAVPPSVWTVCEMENASSVQGLWLGDVEAVLVPPSRVLLAFENLLTRDLELYAIIRRKPVDGIFDYGEVAILFQARSEAGDHVIDTINVRAQHIVSIQFNNSDFSEMELRDPTNEDVIAPPR